MVLSWIGPDRGRSHGFMKDPPPSGSESASIPKTFIHCLGGPTEPYFKTFALRAPGLGWKVRELSADHAAMVTHPRELAEVLLDAAV